ncbi:hypothetical protein BIW11_02684 [Tropilaelaps mercedesae]|uniref:FAM20 C-terminal domain-containing protein n=1 Tax=Tropilaelaps mercedesae TaxID=418985 RepID=A0A1V9XZ08_9ACAR|nr:hypothetical protein BIW11_02684 [Tropilaelaps mercedesae]
MWALYRTTRVLGVACLILTAYLCLAFYNFEADVERLRAHHITHLNRPDEKQVDHHLVANFKNLMQKSHAQKKKDMLKITAEGWRSSTTDVRSEPVVPHNLLAPHLLHLRVAYVVKTFLLPSIVFDNLHDPYEVESVLQGYETQLATAAPSENEKHAANSTWKLAESWVQPRRGVGPYSGEDGTGFGHVLHQLSTSEILAADIAKKGTQLKLLLTLQGEQQAFFKPMLSVNTVVYRSLSYQRGHIIRDGPFAGSDRHNGEIAAFHLARLLGVHRTPFVAGRRISLDEIRQKSTPRLNFTFYHENGRMCFYGKCYYCKKHNGVCGDESGKLEGAVVLMLPSQFRLQSHRSPWQRTYRNGVYARWETDINYCKKVRSIPEFSGRRILDMIDNAVIDFLIGNADRHHVETFQGLKDSPVLLLDNGKSFGNPDEDEFSILAPLYQCCL